MLPEQELWQSKTTCRCSNKLNENQQIYSGLDCLNKNCNFVFGLKQIKKIYDDALGREVSEKVLDEFKHEIDHQETENYNLISECTNESYCMKYRDTSSYGQRVKELKE